MPKVTFEREDVTIECKPGERVLDVADRAGISVFRGIWPAFHCGSSVRGWCNRCKIWVKPNETGATASNVPTGTEKFPIRLNGQVRGTMRLACQVEVTGDLIVHTRSAGPGVQPNLVEWPAVEGPTRWKERWENRKVGAPDKDDDDDKTVVPGG